MKKGKQMKYSSVIICLVLLVCTIFLLPSTAKNQVAVGKGDGKNEKITSVEDLIGMLHCIQRGDYDGTLAVNTEILEAEKTEEMIASLLAFSATSTNSEDKTNTDVKRLASSDKDDASDGKKKTTKYDFDSFTVHEYGHATMDYSYAATSSIMNRELSIYVDGNQSYYHSIGQISSISETTDKNGNKKNVPTLADFDMEFYMDGKHGKVYMKINYFYLVSEESVTFSSEIIGRWVYIESNEFNSIFLSINEYNLSYLSQLSSAISQAYEDGDLKNKTKTQSLSKEDLGDSYEETYNKFDIKIDLSDAESPTISLLMSIDTDFTPSYSASVDALYTFENINNTQKVLFERSA